MASQRVCVTGVGGYVASHVALALLKKGYTVVGTVRSLGDTKKYEFLRKLAEEHQAASRIVFVEADLLSEGSFDSAFKDCVAVMHCASPFLVGKVPDPQKQLIDPAVKGTENVLRSVARNPSVRRVVVTSSVAAIYGDIGDKPGHTYTEEDWNVSSTLAHSPYSYSKTLAERAAWAMASDQSHYTLATVNPSFVMGPSLSGRDDAASIAFVRDMLSGKMRPAVPHLEFGVVDVRDVADAHVAAMEHPSAKGRFICSKESKSLLELAGLLRASRPGAPLPSFELPKPLFYLVGPLVGFDWQFVSNSIGHTLRIDNAKIQSELGIAFARPLQQTLTEMVESLAAQGIVPSA